MTMYAILTTVTRVHFHSRCAPPFPSSSFLFLPAQVAFVVDLDHGCSLSAAWAVGDPAKTNLINTADLGRYVCVLFTSVGGSLARLMALRSSHQGATYTAVLQ